MSNRIPLQPPCLLSKPNCAPLEPRRLEPEPTPSQQSAQLVSQIPGLVEVQATRTQSFQHLDSTGDGRTSIAEIAAGFDRLEGTPAGVKKLNQIREAMANHEAAIEDEAHSAKQVDGLETAAMLVGAGLVVSAVLAVAVPVVGVLAVPMLVLGTLAFLGIFLAGALTSAANQRDNDKIGETQRQTDKKTAEAVAAAPAKPIVQMIPALHPALQAPTRSSGASLR